MGLLSFLTWPIRLVLHSRPGQLAVFLLEKTTQVAADGIEAVVGRETVGTSQVDPAKSGTKEGQGKLAVKSDTESGKTTIKFAAPRNEGYLIRAAQISATILRWLQNWLRSLQGKAPTTGTIEPLEMDDGGGVVATKRSDKVGLVTCALYVLNPLNDIVLAVRLLEYTRGIILVYRNKSSDCSPVAERSPLSPSKNTEFEAKDADSTIKPPTRTQAITKPDTPQRASPTKSPAQTTKVTPAAVPRKIPAAVPRKTPAQSTTLRSPTTPAFSPVKIAPCRTSVPMSQPPSKVAAGPAAQSTASTAEVDREASPQISEHTSDSCKLETKTKTSSKERNSKTKQEGRSKDAVPAHCTIKSPGGGPPVSTAKPSAPITQIPPDQVVSKPSAEMSSTVVLSATVSASPKANTRTVSVQSVSKPLSEAAAADDNTSDVQVPAKISADEPDKVGIKTKPQSNEGSIIDPECRKGETKSKISGQSGEEEPAKEAFISRRTIQPPPSGTVVKPPIRSTDSAVPVADSTANPPAQTSRMAHSYQLVYKTTGLPSKIHLDQSTSKPEAEAARPETSTNRSPSWVTGKPRGGPGRLANMLSRQARDLGSAEYPLDSTTQSPARKAGPSFDQGSSAVPSTKITANTKSETASVKSTTGAAAECTAGISSEGDANVPAGNTDNPGKSGKQSKLKPWKKWKPSKK